MFPFALRNRFACISVTNIVSVNRMDVFPITDIFNTVIVNGENTGHDKPTRKIHKVRLIYTSLCCACQQRSDRRNQSFRLIGYRQLSVVKLVIINWLPTTVSSPPALYMVIRKN